VADVFSRLDDGFRHFLGGVGDGFDDVFRRVNDGFNDVLDNVTNCLGSVVKPASDGSVWLGSSRLLTGGRGAALSWFAAVGVDVPPVIPNCRTGRVGAVSPGTWRTTSQIGASGRE
jgi:hypothetical protein